jgi:hypothetical protein
MHARSSDVGELPEARLHVWESEPRLRSRGYSLMRTRGASLLPYVRNTPPDSFPYQPPRKEQDRTPQEESRTILEQE